MPSGRSASRRVAAGITITPIKIKKAKSQQTSPLKKSQAGFVGLAKDDLQQLHLNNLPPALAGIVVLIGSIAIVDSY